MLRALPYLTGLCIALWLGGLVTLFMFVSLLFKADRATAVDVAPFLFYIFERYQLMLAAIAIACAVVWRLCARSRSKQLLLACLVAAALLSIAQFSIISPRLHAHRAAGEMAAFGRLHGYSMLVYVGTLAMVLIAAGATVTAAMSDASRPRGKTTPTG